MAQQKSPGTDKVLKKAAPRPALTRRSFVRCAGIGMGSLVLGDPLSAFADEADPAGDGLQASAQADDAADISASFKYGGSSKANFIFKHSFFDGSSFSYNSHLATFALCLALASFGGNDNQADYEKAPDNVKDFLGQLRCSDIVCNDFFTKPTEHDSIGLACAHRPVKADGKDYELVMLGIRGANYFYEWCGNLEVGESGDHEGFTTAAGKALDFLKGYVNEKVAVDKPLKLLVAGFSRASATANMLGGLLVRKAHANGVPVLLEEDASGSGKGYCLGGKGRADSSKFAFPKHELYQKDLYVYGYEVPAGAYDSAAADAGVLARWASSTGGASNPFGNIYSIVNPCDMVPMVAPRRWKFGRFGVDRYLPRPSESGYKAARDAMLSRADAIDAGFRGRYPVDSFDRMDLSMDAFFDTMIDHLAHDLIGGQAAYARDYQTALVDAMDYFQSGKLDKLEKVASSGGFKAWVWTEIILKTIGDIVNPISLTVLIVKVGIRLLRGSLLTSMLDDLVAKLRICGWDMGDAENKLYGELRAICPMVQEFALHNLKLFIAILNTFMKDPHTMEVHSATLCLAWMQSYDSNYTAAPSPVVELSALTTRSRAIGAQGGDETAALEAGVAQDALSADSCYKKVLFDGDVVVWALAEGEYVKLFEGGKPVENEVSPYYSFPYPYGLNEDFQMTVILPVDANFLFRLESNPDDEFAITLVRYTGDSELPARIVSYDALGDGKEVVYAGIRIDEDGRGSIWVSATEDEDSAYDCAFEVDNAGGDTNTHCNVVLGSFSEETGQVVAAEDPSNPAGLVFGGGYNVYGSSSLLAALPNDGYEFDYWTVDGKRSTDAVRVEEEADADGTVHTATVFPFYVARDYGDSVEVVAHFKEKASGQAVQGEAAQDGDPSEEAPAQDGGPSEEAPAQDGGPAKAASTASTGDDACNLAAIAGMVGAAAAAAAGLSHAKARKEQVEGAATAGAAGAAAQASACGEEDSRAPESEKVIRSLSA